MLHYTLSDMRLAWGACALLVLAACGVRLQPVNATHWLNRSAGVLKSKVFLGRSLSCRATAINLF
jgi:hypothetical protein